MQVLTLSSCACALRPSRPIPEGPGRWAERTLFRVLQLELLSTLPTRDCYPEVDYISHHRLRQRGVSWLRLWRLRLRVRGTTPAAGRVLQSSQGSAAGSWGLSDCPSVHLAWGVRAAGEGRECRPWWPGSTCGCLWVAGLGSCSVSVPACMMNVPLDQCVFWLTATGKSCWLVGSGFQQVAQPGLRMGMDQKLPWEQGGAKISFLGSLWEGQRLRSLRQGYNSVFVLPFWIKGQEFESQAKLNFIQGESDRRAADFLWRKLEPKSPLWCSITPEKSGSPSWGS